MKPRALLLSALLGIMGCGAPVPDLEARPGVVGPLSPAILLGRFEAQEGTRTPRTLRVTIDDVTTVARVGPDGFFSLHDLPSGAVTARFEFNELSGSLALGHITAGELVRVVVRRGEGALAIDVEPRDEGRSVDVPRERMSSRVIEVRGDGAVYRLPAGVYEGDVVVLGDGVTLLGARRGGSCADADRTVLLGALLIRGRDARVYDVSARGPLDVTGEGPRFQGACDVVSARVGD